jgi:hypothetical protein
VEARTVLKGLGCRLKANSGDIDVLAWAQARECSLSAIIPMQLRFVASKLESLDELTRDEPGANLNLHTTVAVDMRQAIQIRHPAETPRSDRVTVGSQRKIQN